MQNNKDKLTEYQKFSQEKRLEGKSFEEISELWGKEKRKSASAHNMMKFNLDRLINSFLKWYPNSEHVERENTYEGILTKKYLTNLSKDEFITFIIQFAKDGGKVQSLGWRTSGKVKETLENKYDNFREFLFQPFSDDFDLDTWLKNIKNYNGFGEGLATIYLNRIDKNKYPIVNDKSKHALNILGFEIPNSLIPAFHKIRKTGLAFIEFYPELENLYKTDAFTHFLIGEPTGINLIKEQIIDNYIEIKEEKGHEDEFYKYDAVQNFQDNWNPEAKTFHEMLEKALNKYVNLMYYQSYNNILTLAEKYPEKTKELFLFLFDENKPLKERIEYFNKETDNLIQKIDPSWNAFQDERAISVYLAFRYPNKYFFFKDSYYKAYLYLIYQSPKKKLDKYIDYLQKVQDLRDNFVKNTQKLWELTNNQLPKNTWNDPNGHILTQDILFCVLEQINLKTTLKQYEIIESISKGEKPVQKNKTMIPLNLILYGPPGTGKTFQTVNYALAIIEGKTPEEIGNEKRDVVMKRYVEYLNKQIAFITFHQSFSYEDFIEGIKPVMEPDNKIAYHIKDGVFKEITLRAEQNWRKHKENRYYKPNFYEVWDQFITPLGNEREELKVKMKNSSFYITEVNESSIHFRKSSGESSHSLSLTTLEKMYQQGTNNLIKGGLQVYYEPLLEKLTELADEKADKDKEELKKYVLIIDEINRGNISKIFGELITLIEDNKRMGENDETTATLPYSRLKFSIPPNLYIIGTMNTADRSIALIDTALRRRFEFKEMPPQKELLSTDFEGVNLQELLHKINKRIEYLLDRDHRLGHSYFMNLYSVSDLCKIFNNKIIPLLQEYFYNEWEKIRLVLGDNQISELTDEAGSRPFFILKENFKAENLFGKGNSIEELDEKEAYEINKDLINGKFEAADFRKIYET